MRDTRNALLSLPVLAAAVWVLLAANEDPGFLDRFLGVSDSSQKPHGFVGGENDDPGQLRYFNRPPLFAD